MVALVRAMAAIAPPHKPIVIDWPDAIRVDGGLVGGGRLVSPGDADLATPPPWLVFGAVIRLASIPDKNPAVPAPAAREETALEDEGFDETDATKLVEAFARHLMRVTDRWRGDGFAAVAGEYLSHLAPENGAQREIGDHGDLLVRNPSGRAERHGLRQRLTTPSWLGSQDGEPR
jgi:hypothetical protein